MNGIEDVIQRLETTYSRYSEWLVSNKLNVRDRTETIDYRDDKGRRKVNMKLLSIDSQVRWRLENFIDDVSSQLSRLTDSNKLMINVLYNDHISNALNRCVPKMLLLAFTLVI